MKPRPKTKKIKRMELAKKILEQFYKVGKKQKKWWIYNYKIIHKYTLLCINVFNNIPKLLITIKINL